MIDVVHEINAVQRTVGSRVLKAGEARTVTITRTYDADVADLWDACTNPERIARWFLPVTGNLKVGGRFQLQGNAAGTIERCDPPHSFATTWEFGGEISWIEVRLTAESEGLTRFELEHIATVDAQRWAQFGPGAVGVGFDLALSVGLAKHVATGKAVDPREAATWTSSPEVRHFVSLSSQRWRDASIAAGTDPAEAEAAADRTTAFYTGVPV